jgi:hypothetical protein
MRWFPYQRVTIHTPLSAREALDRIREEVEPHRLFGRGMTTLPYRGTIVHYDFTDRRFPNFEMMQNYNLFNRPSMGSIPLTIKGWIGSESGGAEIELVLRLQGQWMIIWGLMFIILIGMYAALNVYIAQGHWLTEGTAPIMEFAWAFLWLLAFIYGITLAYNIESKRTRRLFEEWLEVKA